MLAPLSFLDGARGRGYIEGREQERERDSEGEMQQRKD